MHQLADNVECLLHILLDKLVHLSAEILFDRIQVAERQAEYLHILDALNGEGPPRQHTLVNHTFEITLIQVLLFGILQKEDMVDYRVFVTTVLQDLLEPGHRYSLRIFFQKAWVNDRKHLIMEPRLHKGSHSFGCDLERSNLISLAVEELTRLIILGSKALPNEGQEPLIAHALEEWMGGEGSPINVNRDCYSELRR